MHTDYANKPTSQSNAHHEPLRQIVYIAQINITAKYT